MITIIGCGHMGTALLQGLRDDARVGGRIGAVERDPVRRRAARRRGAVVFKDLNEASGQTEVWVLAVKPQDLPSLLPLLGGVIDPRRQWVISIAAGVRTIDLEKGLPEKTAVVRAMPNLPAVVRQGMTAICRGRRAGRRHMNTAAAVFSTVGRVVEVEERLMDAVTAVSGSGPAYVFHTVECLIEAARRLGLSSAQAELLVRETVAGSVSMWQQGGEEASVLRRRVTSPGGTTQAALDVLTRHRFKMIWIEAVRAARKRAAALSRMIRRQWRG